MSSKTSMFKYLKYVAAIPLAPLFVIKDAFTNNGENTNKKDDDKYSRMKVVYDDEISEGTYEREFDKRFEDVIKEVKDYVDKKIDNEDSMYQ